MTLKQAKNLHSGDEVKWTDPDDDPSTDCSRIYKIKNIEIRGDIVIILESDGSVLECFAKELS